MTQGSERRLLRRLREHVVGEAWGKVLEVGAGTGANFPFYKLAQKIVATEPDPFMLRRAKKRAQTLGLNVEFHQSPAEELPFPDVSFDAVVSTLVLCTVLEPDLALAEIRRVLRPDGFFRFIEHVQADQPPMMRLQNVLTPVWRRLAAGCHLNRRTAESIEAAGFKMVEVQHVALPLMPIIFGVAKPR